MNKKEKEKALRAIGVALLVWQIVAEWVKLIIPFIQWEIKPRVDVWHIALINTLGNGFNLIGALVLGWPEFQMNKKEKEKALRGIGVALLVWQIVAEWVKLIIPFIQWEIKPRVDVWHIALINTLGNGFNLIGALVLGWPEFQMNKKEKEKALRAIGVALLVWQIVAEWVKLIIPFIQWEIKPRVDVWHIALINTLGNGFNLIGALVLGWPEFQMNKKEKEKALRGIGVALLVWQIVAEWVKLIIPFIQWEIKPRVDVWHIALINTLGNGFNLIGALVLGWPEFQMNKKEKEKALRGIGVALLVWQIVAEWVKLIIPFIQWEIKPRVDVWHIALINTLGNGFNLIGALVLGWPEFQMNKKEKEKALRGIGVALLVWQIVAEWVKLIIPFIQWEIKPRVDVWHIALINTLGNGFNLIGALVLGWPEFQMNKKEKEKALRAIGVALLVWQIVAEWVKLIIPFIQWEIKPRVDVWHIALINTLGNGFNLIGALVLGWPEFQMNKKEKEKALRGIGVALLVWQIVAEWVKLIIPFIQWEIKPRVDVWHIALINTLGNGFNLIGALVLGWPEFQMNKKEKEKALRGIGVALLVWQIVAEWVKLIIPFIQWEIKPRVDVWHIALINTLGNGFNLIGALVLGWPEFQMNKKEKEKALRAIGVALLVWQIVAEWVKLIIPFIQWEIKPRVDVWHIALINTLGNGFNLIGALVLGWPEFQMNKKEKEKALRAIGVALLVWQIVAEWVKLIIPFIQWEIKPRVDVWHIALINTLGNGLNLIGALVLGWPEFQMNKKEKEKALRGIGVALLVWQIVAEWVKLIIPFIQWEIKPRVDVWHIALINTLGNGFNLIGALVLGWPEFQMNKKEKEKALRGIGVALLVWQIVAEWVKLIIPFIQWEIKPRVDVWHIALINTLGNGFNLIGALVLGWPEFQMNKKEKEKALRAIGVALLVWQIVAEWVKLIIPFIQWEIKPRVDVWHIALINTLGNGFNLIGALVLGWPEFQMNKKEKEKALRAIGVALLVWQIVAEWVKLIIPFIQWEIKPRVDVWHIALINTLGNGFNLIGALVLGWPEFQMNKKEKEKALRAIGVALLVWQIVAEWVKLIIPFIQWEIKPRVDVWHIALINTLGNGLNLIGALVLGWPEFQMNKKEKEKALRGIGVALLVWQIVAEWVKLIIPFIQWEIKPRVDVWYIALINTLGNGFNLIGALVLGWPEFQMNKKEKEKALRAIGVALLVWQIVAEWVKLIIPFIQWEIKPRVDVWHIALINTLGNGFNLIGALVLGWPEFQMNKKEKEKALRAIGVALLVWQIVAEWVKLIIPFIQWEIKPRVDVWHIALINTLGNGFNLIGALVLGHALDRWGFRACSVAATVSQGLLFVLSSVAEMLPLWLAMQVLRLPDHFKQICEAQTAWLSSDASPSERTQRILRLSIPTGLALVLGPLIGVKVIMHFGSTKMSTGIGGIVLFICLLPCALFLVPEPENTGSGGPRLPSLRAYGELLRSSSLRRLLIYKLLVELPFQAFDTMSRTYMVFFLVQSPGQMALTIGVAGGATLFTCLVLIRVLQRFLNPLQMIQGALAYLTVLYAVFGPMGDHSNLILLVPLQMIGVSLCLSELNSQILNSGGKEEMGKLAGLSQVITLAAMTVMPIFSGYFVSYMHMDIICYASAVICGGALAAVSFTGSFLAREQFFLPSGVGGKTNYSD